MLQDDLYRRRKRDVAERRGPTQSAQLSIKENGVERNEWQKFKDLDAEPCREGLKNGDTSFESDDSIGKNISQHDSSTELNSKIWHSEIKKLASIARITALRRLKDNSHLFLQKELYICSKKSLPDKDCITSMSNQDLKSVKSNNSLSEILAVQAEHIKKLSQDIKLKLGLKGKHNNKSSNEGSEIGNTEKVKIRDSKDGHDFIPKNNQLKVSSDKSETHLFGNKKGSIKNITCDGRELGFPLLSVSDRYDKQQNCSRYILECDPVPKTLLKNTKRVIKDITNSMEIKNESGKSRTANEILDFGNSKILSPFANTERPMVDPSLNSDSAFNALHEITDIYGPCRKKSMESMSSLLSNEDSEGILLNALMEFHKDFASENNKNLEDIIKIKDETSRCKQYNDWSKDVTCFKAANILNRPTFNSRENKDLNLLGLSCSHSKYAEKPFVDHSSQTNFSKRLKRNLDQNYGTSDLNHHISSLTLFQSRNTNSGNNTRHSSNTSEFHNSNSSENQFRQNSTSCSKNVNKNPILSHSIDHTTDNQNKKSSARSIFSTKSLNPNSPSDPQPVKVSPKELVALMKKSYRMSEVIYSSEPEQEEEPNQEVSPKKQIINSRKLDKTRKIQKANDELISERDELMKFKSKMLSKVEIFETDSSKNLAETEIVEQDFKKSKKEMMNKKSLMLENVNNPKHAQEFLSDLSLLKTKYIKLIGFQNSSNSKSTNGDTFYGSCKSQTTQDRDIRTNSNEFEEQEQIFSQLHSSSKVLKNQLVVLKDHLGAILGSELFKQKQFPQNNLNENISEGLGRSNRAKTPQSPTRNTEEMSTQNETNNKVDAPQEDYLKIAKQDSPSVNEPTFPLPPPFQANLKYEPSLDICEKDKSIHEFTTNNEIVFVNKDINKKPCNPEHVILTSSGKPVRLFNKAGYPLTDRKGRRLKNILGVEMLPESDLFIMQERKFQVFDAFNYLPGSSSFDPSKIATPTTQHEIQIIDKFTNPTKLYNALGLPLSDCDGYILRDNHGNFVVVLDSIGIPMCCTNGEPIYMEDGKLWILEKDSYDVLHRGNFNKLKKVLDRTYFNINDSFHNGNLKTFSKENKEENNVTSELASKTDLNSYKNEEDQNSQDKLSLLSVSSLLNIKNSFSFVDCNKSSRKNKCILKPNKLHKKSSTYELLHTKTDSTNLFKKLKGRSKPIGPDKILKNYNINPAIIQVKRPLLANIKKQKPEPQLLQLHLSSFGTDTEVNDESMPLYCNSPSYEYRLDDELCNRLQKNEANGDFSRNEEYINVPKKYMTAKDLKKIRNHRPQIKSPRTCSAIDLYKKNKVSNVYQPLKSQNQRKNIMVKKGIKKSFMRLTETLENNNDKGNFRQSRNVKKKSGIWKPRRPLYFEL